MIRLEHFSESTLALYNACKSGDVATSDLIDVLLESDFSKKEIKSFLKKHFPVICVWLIEIYEL
ncbi:hypothetical protein [Bacteroides sedimenti]|uniref:hypothetical protein n=1 Tax=Bacteroides sedimenti TaxID=2136147 RepID=UPI00333FF32A